MNRIAAYLTWAALGAVLVASGPAWAQAYRYSPDGYAYDYGYPNNYAYGYGSPNAYGYGSPNNYAYGYGSPNNYAYGYGSPYKYASPFGLVEALTAPVTGAAAATASLVTGRSVATGQSAPLAAAPPIAAAAATAPLMTGRSVATAGNYCTTPAKTCLLYHSSWVGNGCSCRMRGGPERGSVTP